VEHRAPEDDVRVPYDRSRASALSRLHAITIVSAENQVHDYYMNIGPLFSDPVARLLYAEIASIEEQHVTHYESIVDPSESTLEKWMLHEAAEAYNYLSCMQSESNSRIRDIWERFLHYELGQLNHVMDLFRSVEGRDPFEVLPTELPEPIKYESHRDFVRKTLNDEVALRALATEIVPAQAEGAASIAYRERLNSRGSPSDIVASSYVWTPGGEVARMLSNDGSRRQEAMTP
jgi:hypothetical protein